MTNILKPGETGFGMLIERDAGYIDNTLNKNILNEEFKVEPNKPLYINCILQKWGVENKNGRVYPKEILVPQINEYQKFIDSNSAVSEADHPDCVLPDSEILTKNGWKFISDISEDEEIQTLNTNTNKIEIQKIDKKIYEDYNGEMLEFKSLNFDMTVTPNHRFLLENMKGERFYVTAENIYDDINNVYSSGKYKILKKGDWEGEYLNYFTLKGMKDSELRYNIKGKFKHYCKDIKIKSEDWFAFLGIFLADGHSCGTVSKKERSSGFDVCITQKKEKNKQEIESLLNRLPFEYSTTSFEDGKNQYHIHDGRLYNYLYKLGSSQNKYIPIEIKNASKDLLEIFFEWFSMGDGRNVKTKFKSNKKSVFSTSKKLIDDLQEVLIKIGGSGNISEYQPKDRVIKERKKMVLEDGTEEFIETERKILSENSELQYNLNISSTNYIWLDNRSIKIKKINYCGKIACVRVGNSNFMVKRNGKCHWTGNSSVISLHNISHMLTKMWWGSGDQENFLFGTLKLIITPGFINMGIVSVVGDKVLLYLQNGVKLGISSRGVGSLKEIGGKNIVQDDFELIGFDLVATPSTPGAYLYPGVTNIEQAIGENTNKKNNELNEHNNKIYKTLDSFLLKN